MERPADQIEGGEGGGGIGFQDLMTKRAEKFY